MPFYDLYALKQGLETKYVNDLSKMREKAKDKFKRVIREINAEYARILKL